MKFFFLLSTLFFINFLAFSQIQNIPVDTTFTLYQTYLKQKKNFPQIKIIEAKLLEGIVEQRGLVYQTIDSTPFGKRLLVMDMFRPKGRKKLPAIILIHGGGWSSGERSQQEPLAIHLAAKGYACFTLEYRLSPEAAYPAAICDVKSAVIWLRANAGKFGVKASKIALLGCSAGGQLANLVGAGNNRSSFNGCQADQDISSEVQAVVNIDGISDFTSPASIENARKARANQKLSADIRWLGGTFDEVPEKWKEASPVYWVSAQSAPVCYINSAIPRFHYGQEEMVRKLGSFGIYTEVHQIPDTPHPFWFFDPWFSPTLDYTVKFLDKVLKSK